MSVATRPEVFPRTQEQRLAALAKGNVTRTARAEMKRDLRARKADPIPLIAFPPAWLQSMKLIDFLPHLPIRAFGPAKAQRLMNRCFISYSKTVGGLSDRQRNELLAELRGLGFGS